MHPKKAKKIKKTLADILGRSDPFARVVHEVLGAANHNKRHRSENNGTDVDLDSLREMVSVYLQSEDVRSHCVTLAEKLHEILDGLEHADPTTKNESLDSVTGDPAAAMGDRGESDEERVHRIASSVQKSLADLFGR